MMMDMNELSPGSSIPDDAKNVLFVKNSTLKIVKRDRRFFSKSDFAKVTCVKIVIFSPEKSPFCRLIKCTLGKYNAKTKQKDH